MNQPIVAMLAIALTISSMGAQKKKKQQQPTGPFPVPDMVAHTPYGDIRLQGLTIGLCAEFGGMGSPYMQGMVTNPTSHTFSSLFIDMYGKEANGSRKLLDIIILSDFSPSKSVSLASLSISRCGTPLDYDGAGGIELSYKSGEVVTAYRLALTKPSPDDPMRFEDETLLAQFALTRTSMALAVLNKSDAVLRINWDQASFIDWTGKSHQVTHEGVKYADKNSNKPATPIPPTARIEDSLIPADNISFGSKDWNIERLLPAGIFSDELIGKQISVYLPIERAGKTLDYVFAFKILGTAY